MNRYVGFVLFVFCLAVAVMAAREPLGRAYQKDRPFSDISFRGRVSEYNIDSMVHVLVPRAVLASGEEVPFDNMGYGIKLITVNTNDLVAEGLSVAEQANYSAKVKSAAIKKVKARL